MKQRFFRSFCVFLVSVFVMTSVAVTGCNKGSEPDETIEKTTKETTIEETEQDETEPTDAAQITDEPLSVEELALDKALDVGLSEEDLRGEYELFLKYAEAVDENPELFQFRGYVYNLFPIVVDHFDSEDEERLLVRLRSLYLVEEPPYDGIACYEEIMNKVTIGVDDAVSPYDMIYANVVYHELIHFLDRCAEDQLASVCFMKDGSIVPGEEIPETEEDRVKERNYGRFLFEAGTEYIRTQYFSITPISTSYVDEFIFLKCLEYIFGSDMVEDMYFDNNSPYCFAEFLSDNGFSNEEIFTLMSAMEESVNTDEVAKENYMLPSETLKRLYESHLGTSADDDADFCKMLEMMTWYYDDNGLVKMWSFLSSSSVGLAEQFGTSAEDIDLLSVSTPSLVDGKFKLVFAFGYADDKDHKMCAVADYDFENDEFGNVEIIDKDWYPTYSIDELRSRDNKEAQELISDLTYDNSEAHEQTVTGKRKKYEGLYERAVDIGNRYGIQIWFGDIVSEELLGDITLAKDPKTISLALDKIEKVLELYPEDYFDQLLFEYYSGFVICIFDEATNQSMLHNSLYVDGKYYMTVFVNAGITFFGNHYGTEEIRNKYFGTLDYFYVRMICDIWNCTEITMANRDLHFTGSSSDSDAWIRVNGTDYLNTIQDTALIEKSFADSPDGLYLCKEAMTSFRTERMLIYEYIMLSALYDKTADFKSGEGQEKARLLFAEIRDFFDTESWPDETSWEKAPG